jgi:predicted small secreted protein
MAIGLTMEKMSSVCSSFNRCCLGYVETSFEIDCFESNNLKRLFHEANSYAQGIKIKMVRHKRCQSNKEENPATLLGLNLQYPTIQFVDSLDKTERVEVIAHELLHLLLVYRFGLGVIGRRAPHCGSNEDVFRYFMSMTGDWIFLLGQVANTAHHLILTEFLKEEYGIKSDLHLHLLNQNFKNIMNDNSWDKESLYAKGLIAFEYEKLIGHMDQVIDSSKQPDSFWESYHFAQKHFRNYSFRSIPTPSSYEDDILSFLGDLGYQKQDFIFFPESSSNRFPPIYKDV